MYIGRQGSASISNNTANYYGGVFVFGGSFTMTGDSITGNTASDSTSYGGVYFSSGTFNLSGAPELKGNVKGGTITNGSLIRLPKNCTIDGTAFSGCTSLIAIYAPAGGTTETWANGNGIPFIEQAE